MSDKERIAALEAGVRQLVDVFTTCLKEARGDFKAADTYSSEESRAWGVAKGFSDSLAAIKTVFAPLGIATGEGEGAGDGKD